MDQTASTVLHTQLTDLRLHNRRKRQQAWVDAEWLHALSPSVHWLAHATVCQLLVRVHGLRGTVCVIRYYITLS
jgi:hypothetical protein